VTEQLRRAGAVAWAGVGIAAAAAVVFYVLWKIRVVFPPLIFAGAIVFLLNPVVTRLQRRGVPRAAAAGISYLGVIGLLVLAGFLITPLAADQIGELRDEWPEIRDKSERWIDDRAEQSENWIIQLPTVQEIENEFDNADQTLSDQWDQVRDIGLAVFHVLLILVLGPIIAFYLLVDVPHLRRVAESLVPDPARAEVMHVARRLNRAIGGFFRGQLLVAAIVGVMCSVGLAIIDLQFWFLVGMIAGVFNIVPLIGPWIGGIPGVVIALTTGSPGKAVLVVLIMAGAQQIDNHFITPQVMQRAVRLHPAVVILALVAGGTLGGFFGLLMAVPVAAAIKIVLGHLWRVHILGEPFEQAVAEEAVEDAEPGVGIVKDVLDGDDGPEAAEKPAPEATVPSP
jgi:predicted PurR-regulated permease PerM